MIKKFENLKNALDTTSEISKLLKVSPKRQALLKKITEDFAPKFPGFRTLCPTRWTVRGGSLQSVVDNRNVFQELWDECLETKLEPDIKGRIIGVKRQMGIFDYFCGVYVGEMLLKHSDNLSHAVQTSHISAAECQLVATFTTKKLTKIRTEEAFLYFGKGARKLLQN